MGKLRTALAAFVCMIILASGAYADSWKVENDVVRLNSEAPSLMAFPDSPGVVWMRNAAYNLLADGTLEKKEQWLILMCEKMPPRWTDWAVPIPIGGSGDMEEAAWYNPMTGVQEGRIEIRREDTDGIEIIRASVPKEAAGRVVAVSWTVRFPSRTNVDGALFLAMDLPLWEQRVEVNVPGDKMLFWDSHKVTEPRKSSDRGADRYVWTISNQAPWYGGTLMDDRRPKLVFSLRKGIVSSLMNNEKLVSTYAAFPLPEGISAKRDKAAARIAAFVDKAPVVPSVGWQWLRQEPPAKGPWTVGERALLAAAWIRRCGYNVKVWWQPQVTPNENGPSTDMMWERPVLEIADGTDTVYYLPGQAAVYGRLAPDLYGEVLYRADGDKLEKKTMPMGSPSEHRLSMDWNFEMNEYGVAEGTLELTVRGAWVQLMAAGGMPAPEAIGAWIAENLRFEGPRLMFKSYSIKKQDYGFTVQCKLSCPLALTTGSSSSNMLVRFPGTVPAKLEDMLKTTPPYRLNFPFMIEQNAYTSVPPGYELLGQPNLIRGEKGSSSLQQKLVFWPKKRQLYLNNSWTVKGGEVDQMQAKVLVEQTLQLVGSLAQGIPLKKK